MVVFRGEPEVTSAGDICLEAEYNIFCQQSNRFVILKNLKSFTSIHLYILFLFPVDSIANRHLSKDPGLQTSKYGNINDDFGEIMYLSNGKNTTTSMNYPLLKI